MIITKHETGENFGPTIIRPNKDSIICCITVYLSPNDKTRFKTILDRVNIYVQGLLVAYSNII